MLALISVEIPAASCVSASAGKVSRLTQLAVGDCTGHDLTSVSVRAEVVRDRQR